MKRTEIWFSLPVQCLVGCWGVRLASINEGEIISIAVLIFGPVHGKNVKTDMLYAAIEKMSATHWFPVYQ